jgi:hypothetical protein
MVRSIVRFALCFVAVAPVSPAHAQTTLTVDGVGAVYGGSESFDLPGLGALLVALGGIAQEPRPR